MCAMGLVHFRVARVIYCCQDSQFGALGGKFRLHDFSEEPEPSLLRVSYACGGVTATPGEGRSNLNLSKKHASVHVGFGVL
jgi:tRNA(Arg) A34 adenosine deaminase TadA